MRPEDLLGSEKVIFLVLASLDTLSRHRGFADTASQRVETYKAPRTMRGDAFQPEHKNTRYLLVLCAQIHFNGSFFVHFRRHLLKYVIAM